MINHRSVPILLDPSRDGTFLENLANPHDQFNIPHFHHCDDGHIVVVVVVYVVMMMMILVPQWWWW
jgi:hypothetical protein